MDRPLVALVLAGGTGTRLYPASRSDRPKQFRSFGGDDSLLTRTVDRLDFADEVLVLTRPAFAEAAAAHAPSATVLTEPAGKDTGPALVYGTALARERVQAGVAGVGAERDPVVLAVPSDHHVGDDEAFAATMQRGAAVADDAGSLVTFGVEPDRPATGYGYVQPGDDHGNHATVEAFHEKPDRETAARYVAEGALWNAGLFAWTPAALRSAAADTPLSALSAALAEAAGEGPEAVAAAGEAVYPDIDGVSIDYAVMERADDVAVVSASFPWDDLGAWDALGRAFDDEADADGNVALTEAVTVDAADNVVAGDKHVSLVGVEGLAVVAVDDRVLVVPKGEAQRVREVVAELREEGRF
ncbi:MAG: mannose-1-phosphate guanylyltransferase [Halolamina sp.]